MEVLPGFSPRKEKINYAVRMSLVYSNKLFKDGNAMRTEIKMQFCSTHYVH